MTTETPLARAKTFDGTCVELWHDGTVTTTALAFQVRGAGAARVEESRQLFVQAGFAVLGEACLFERSELPRLVREARKLARRGQLSPGALRAVAG